MQFLLQHSKIETLQQKRFQLVQELALESWLITLLKTQQLCIPVCQVKQEWQKASMELLPKLNCKKKVHRRYRREWASCKEYKGIGHMAQKNQSLAGVEND